MNTNSNTYKLRIDKVINDAVYDEAADEGITSQEYIRKRFYEEYSWSIDRIGKQNSVCEWLQGLAIDLPYTYAGILYLYEQLHGEELTDSKKIDRVCDNYWRHMAMHVIRFAGI
jgi:hypothetical protein